jgi:hypothetical protein
MAAPTEAGGEVEGATGTKTGHTESLIMNRLLMFVGMILGGYLGWWVGDYIGLGLMGTFLVSSLGSIAGVCLAWRIMSDYFW